jgi:cytoskeletal protein CcmA (bactofilin family)
MNKPLDTPNQDLIIGEGVSFTGSIEAPGKAIIGGAISGSIAAQDLLVETTGTTRPSASGRPERVYRATAASA